MLSCHEASMLSETNMENLLLGQQRKSVKERIQKSETQLLWISGKEYRKPDELKKDWTKKCSQGKEWIQFGLSTVLGSNRTDNVFLTSNSIICTWYLPSCVGGKSFLGSCVHIILWHTYTLSIVNYDYVLLCVEMKNHPFKTIVSIMLMTLH